MNYFLQHAKQRGRDKESVEEEAAHLKDSVSDLTQVHVLNYFLQHAKQRGRDKESVEEEAAHLKDSVSDLTKYMY